MSVLLYTYTNTLHLSSAVLLYFRIIFYFCFIYYIYYRLKYVIDQYLKFTELSDNMYKCYT